MSDNKGNPAQAMEATRGVRNLVIMVLCSEVIAYE